MIQCDFTEGKSGITLESSEITLKSTEITLIQPILTCDDSGLAIVLTKKHPCQTLLISHLLFIS